MNEETALAAMDHQTRISSATMEQVLIGGDLSKLTPAQRTEYYGAVCKSLGLNPLTKPFEYLTLNGKLRLYATRDCTDQLRRRDKVSISGIRREVMQELCLVTAHAKTEDGREDESTGAVSIRGLKDDALANALMKAETKAKRRVTLSITGLGWLDESEMDSLPRTPIPQADSTPEEVKELSPRPEIKSENELRASLVKEIFALLTEAYPEDDERSIQIKRNLVSEYFGCKTNELRKQSLAALGAGLQGLKEMLATAYLSPPGDSSDETPAVDPIEEDAVEDKPPLPTGEGTRPYATGEQISKLKLLAQQLGEKASNEINDVLSHYPKGLPMETYTVIEKSLKNQLKEKRESAVLL